MYLGRSGGRAKRGQVQVGAGLLGFTHELGSAFDLDGSDLEEGFFEHLKEESLCHGASGIGEDIGVDEFGPPIPHLELMEIAAVSG